MIAYRLGALPDAERALGKEHEQLPTGPRLSMEEAARVRLPDGTLFGEATSRQVRAWFVRMFKQAGESRRVLSFLLADLNLAEWDHRWWALNEVLEESSALRSVFWGKPVRLMSAPPQGAFSSEALDELVASYGLHLSVTRRQNGTAYLYADQTRSRPRKRIYLAPLAAFERGEVTRELVIERIAKQYRKTMTNLPELSIYKENLEG